MLRHCRSANRSSSWDQRRADEIRPSERALLGGGLAHGCVLDAKKKKPWRGTATALIYFAGTRKARLFTREDIEAANDQVIWSTHRCAIARGGAGTRPLSADTA